MGCSGSWYRHWRRIGATRQSSEYVSRSGWRRLRSTWRAPPRPRFEGFRMRTSRGYGAFAVLLSFGWLLAGGCGSSSDDEGDDSGGPTAGGGSALGGKGGAAPLFSPDASTPDPGPSNGRNPLCGDSKTGGCSPDSLVACRNYEPPSVPGLGGMPAVGGEGGANGGGAAGAEDGGTNPGGAGAAQAGAGNEGGG